MLLLAAVPPGLLTMLLLAAAPVVVADSVLLVEPSAGIGPVAEPGLPVSGPIAMPSSGAVDIV